MQLLGCEHKHPKSGFWEMLTHLEPNSCVPWKALCLMAERGAFSSLASFPSCCSSPPHFPVSLCWKGGMTCGLHSGTTETASYVSLQWLQPRWDVPDIHGLAQKKSVSFLLTERGIGRLCLGMMGPVVNMEPEDLLHGGRARASLVLGGTQWVEKEHPQVT